MGLRPAPGSLLASVKEKPGERDLRIACIYEDYVHVRFCASGASLTLLAECVQAAREIDLRRDGFFDWRRCVVINCKRAVSPVPLDVRFKL
mmetsp:Transcript_949/g.1492  ORF Transcript_949/g.1492 Transcript_949/m.1492 type:complete len:91 (-) Transcript_949:2090-2362(-)